MKTAQSQARPVFPCPRGICNRPDGMPPSAGAYLRLKGKLAGIWPETCTLDVQIPQEQPQPHAT